MRVTTSHLDVGKQKPTFVALNEFRQASSPTDGLVVSDAGMEKVQLVQHRPGCTEGDLKRDVLGGSLMNLSTQPSYRSCIHREVPLRSTSSVVFLDKSLSISLVELQGRGAGQPTLYRTTLSVRLSAVSCCRSSKYLKAAKANGVCRRARAAVTDSNKSNGQEMGLGHRSGPVSKQRRRQVEQTAHADGNNKVDNSDTERRCSALGLLSLQGPNPPNTKAGRQKENADEAVSPSQSSFRQQVFNIRPVDSWSKQTVTAITDEHSCPSQPQNVSALDKTCFYRSRLRPNSVEEQLPQTLTLKEALRDPNPDLVQGLREDVGRQKRNWTTPDPLSNNLFRPTERSISGKEMQLRSRRIYNKLPEVTKRREEEKRRAVSQTNRLRAEVFKKRLLDQVLQR